MQKAITASLVLALSAASSLTTRAETTFTPAQLAQHAVERRAVETVNWGMSVVNFDLMRQAMLGLGGKDNEIAAAGEIANGWKLTFAGGRAGYDPGLRAALAKYEIGAQLSDQVIYPNTSVDDRGESLTGEKKYVLHFDSGKLSPVSVFWNMAMYGSDMLFVENDFGRYSIGSTTEGLKNDAEGTLTILIQKDRPADTSNWPPAPAGVFNLTMRFYGPETSVLDGSYRLPGVQWIQ